MVQKPMNASRQGLVHYKAGCMLLWPWNFLGFDELIYRKQIVCLDFDNLVDGKLIVCLSVVISFFKWFW